MIIKNPYRFLSKHYKVICFLMLIPLLYLTLKFSDIAKFFRDYVASSYRTFETQIADTYITGLCLITIGLTLLFNGFITIVFSSKKRESLPHIIIMLYCVLLFISCLIFHTSMNSIESGRADPTVMRVIRDFANIAMVPGFIILPYMLATAIGFNIKTFKIERYYDSFAVDEDGMEDDIEIKVGENENTAKGGIVHFLREAKYYVLENKFVLKIIGIFILILIGINLYMNFQVYNKKYNANQSFVLDNFSMSLKGSYLTNVDYRGNIVNDGKYYLAVKIAIKNEKKGSVENNSLSIDSSNFRIFIGKEEIFPNYGLASGFIDIGKDYRGEKIAPQNLNDYVFVYELREDQLQTQYQMKILTGSKLNDGNKVVNTYKIINVKPENILKGKDLGSAKVDSEITLKETVLGNTTYRLKELSLSESFQYKYEVCDINNRCQEIRDTLVQSGGKVLVIVKDEIKWDQDTAYYKNSGKDFYGDFVKIEYTYPLKYTDELKYRTETTILKNVTPSQVTDYKIYEAPIALTRATRVKLIYTIRNKYFTIDLTDYLGSAS